MPSTRQKNTLPLPLYVAVAIAVASVSSIAAIGWAALRLEKENNDEKKNNDEKENNDENELFNLRLCIWEEAVKTAPGKGKCVENGLNVGAKLQRLFENDPHALVKVFDGQAGDKALSDILYANTWHIGVNGQPYPPLAFLLSIRLPSITSRWARGEIENIRNCVYHQAVQIPSSECHQTRRDNESRLTALLHYKPDALPEIFFNGPNGAQPLQDLLFIANTAFSHDGSHNPILTFLLKHIQITHDALLNAFLRNDQASVALYSILDLACQGYMAPYEKLIPVLKADRGLLKLLVKRNGLPAPHHRFSQCRPWSLHKLAQELSAKGHPEMLNLILKIIHETPIHELRNVSDILEIAIKHGWTPPSTLIPKRFEALVLDIKRRGLTNCDQDLTKSGYYYSANGFRVTTEAYSCPPLNKPLPYAGFIAIKDFLMSMPFNEATNPWNPMQLALFLLGKMYGLPQEVEMQMDCVGVVASLLNLLATSKLPSQIADSRFVVVNHELNGVAHTVLAQVGPFTTRIIDGFLGMIDSYPNPDITLPATSFSRQQEDELLQALTNKHCFSSSSAFSCVMAMQVLVQTLFWKDVVQVTRMIRLDDLPPFKSTLIPIDLASLRALSFELSRMNLYDLSGTAIHACLEIETREVCQQKLLAKLSPAFKAAGLTARKKLGGTVFFVEESTGTENGTVYYRPPSLPSLK